ncbi:phytase [Carboxylicivirga sediminis]|uniref:Phytase n=1 Tax=Carboxylicivirga sediminis TaxID=2006564 RepID=A0A941F9W6_9BACT|nr:phytase [Carboxylicivirga sediminis]MBR8537814.1 phytase [Carboxylicivirga sediminis]
MRKLTILLAITIGLAAGCRHKAGTLTTETSIASEKMDGRLEAIEDSAKKANALQLQSQITRVVHPSGQTQAVDQESGVDAADDPAIWYNADNPGESRILGTDKQAGLGLYDLKGKLVFFHPTGRVNNVDLRYNFPMGNEKIALAAATERNANALVLYRVTADSLIALQKSPVPLDSAIIDDAYGCCMYYSAVKNRYYAFVGGKNGQVQQWLISNANDQIEASVVRQITFASQCEGMVADDEEGILYVAEEGHGIWKLSAEEDADNSRVLLANSDSLNTNIAYDLEGLDIFYAGENKGYLIASVQGNFSYAIFEKEKDNRYLGNFIIKASETIDGVEETDGLAVTNLALGAAYPSGMLVVQDGFNTEGDSDQPQNFKLLDWNAIAKQYNEPLKVAPSHIWWE